MRAKSQMPWVVFVQSSKAEGPRRMALGAHLPVRLRIEVLMVPQPLVGWPRSHPRRGHCFDINSGPSRKHTLPVISSPPLPRGG